MGKKGYSGWNAVAATVHRRRVRASGLWWRVDFDGYRVTVVRRWLPVPGLRARRIRLAEVISADLPSLGGENEWRRFELYLRGGRYVGVGHQMGVRPRVHWFEVCSAIEYAIRARELSVLRSTVGLGPWGEEEWARVEALVPEITAFATHVYEEEPGTLPHRVEVSHRVGVETLLSRLRDMGKPYPVTGGGIALKWRDMRNPDVKRQQEIQDRGEAWATLIERLQNGAEVTATAGWAEQVEAIFDSVRGGGTS